MNLRILIMYEKVYQGRGKLVVGYYPRRKKERGGEMKWLPAGTPDRSWINLDQVAQLTPEGADKTVVHLSNGTKITVHIPLRDLLEKAENH